MKSLKEIITNDNIPVDFSLFDEKFTISAERHVYNELRKKYLVFANNAYNQYIAVENTFKKLDDLVNRVNSTFTQLLSTAMQEVINDAFSVGILTLDINTLYTEYYNSGLMDKYINAYFRYEEFYNEVHEELQSNKEYRRDCDRSFNTSLAIHGYDATSFALDAAMERAIENSREKRAAKRAFKITFNDAEARKDLRYGVWVGVLNLYLYITDYFPRKCNIKLGGRISKNAHSTAIAALNNIRNPALAIEHKKDIVKIILENDPYLEDAYPAFVDVFPNQTKQFVVLGDFFGVSSIIKKVNNNLIDFVKNNMGSTEDDLEKCKSLLEPKLSEIGITKQAAAPVYAFIQARSNQLDLEYRTVEGTVLNTRTEADEVREALRVNENMLQKDCTVFIMRTDYLNHIEALRKLPIPQPILNNYILKYEQKLKEFDKKCKLAALYEESLKAEKRSFKSKLLSFVTSAESQKKAWEEITHNGQYNLDEITNTTNVS